MAKSKTKKTIQIPIEELNRLYAEGYRKKREQLNWAKSSVKLVSKRLPKEKW